MVNLIESYQINAILIVFLINCKHKKEKFVTLFLFKFLRYFRILLHKVYQMIGHRFVDNQNTTF